MPRDAQANTRAKVNARLQREHARFPKRPEKMSYQELWSALGTQLGIAEQATGRYSSREGFYAVVRARAYAEELRLRGEQLSFPVLEQAAARIAARAAP